MILPWLKKNRLPSKLIGLDIGSHAIKLVGLQCEAGCYKPSYYAIESISPPTSIDQETPDLTLVTQAIQKITAHAPLQTRKVAIAVPDSFLMSQRIYIEKSVNDLEAAVTIAASHAIPYPLDAVYFDFQILRPAHDKPNCLEILLVACHKQPLESRLCAVKASGLVVQVVEAESHALERAYECFYSLDPWEKFGLIEIGQSKLSILLRSENEIACTYSEALRHPDNVQAIVLALRKKLQLLFARYLQESWDRLLFVGGNCLLPAVVQQLRQEYGWNACLASTRHSTDRRLMASFPCLFLSCGLALRAYEVH